MPRSSAVILDDFNRASLGANYAQLNTAQGDITMNASTAFCGGAANAEANGPAAIYSGSGTTLGNDQWASAVVGGLSFLSATYHVGVGVRGSGAGATRSYYAFVVYADGSGPTYGASLFKVVAGTYTQLFTASITVANGDRVDLEVEGTTLRACKNGTPLGGGWTLTDASISSGDIVLAGGGGTGTITGDNLEAGNFGPASAQDQEGARFGVDDGSESAHTWSQAQDVNDAAALGTARLIRLLIDGTGDPAAAAYTLRYQKNGAGGYLVMPVGPSVAEAYGTVTFGAIGTGANGGTTVAPQPASPPAGAYMIAVITSGATNSETPTAPDGTWTLLATGASTDGTYGIDTGPRRVTVFGKVAAGTEGTTAVTFSITNGGTCRGTISHFTKAGSGAWDVQAFGADDSTSGTGVSMTFASMNWNTGDAVLVATGQRSGAATQSAQSLTASGVTFGTRTNRAATAVTTGNDHRHTVDTFAAVSGTSNVNAAPTWAYTASAAVSAGGVIVRLREYTAPSTNEIYIATSANITAGGEATTARLTAPSGKTAGDFVTGRRWDDENGADTIDITVDDYTEVEWCLNTQSPATNGDYFDFRVYAGATALATYTVTPRLTLGSPPAFVPVRHRRAVRTPSLDSQLVEGKLVRSIVRSLIPFGSSVYAYLGSGQVQALGAAAVSKTKAFLPSGGSTASGAAPKSRTKAFTSSGQLVVSGSAPLSKVKQFSASGLAQISGSVVVSRTKHFLASGVHVISGAGVTSSTGLLNKQYTGSGLLLASGASAVSRLRDFAASGGAQISGSAPRSKMKVFNASGAAVIAGAALLSRLRAYIGNGLAQLSGAASTSLVSAGGGNTYTGSGQINISGSPTRSRTKAYTAAGGAAITGTALLSKRRQWVGSGVMLTSGAASTGNTGLRAYTGSGLVQTAGGALLSRARNFTASGNLLASGSAPRARTKAWLVTGGVQMSGAALLVKLRQYYPSGLLSIAGVAFTGFVDGTASIETRRTLIARAPTRKYTAKQPTRRFIARATKR